MCQPSRWHSLNLSSCHGRGRVMGGIHFGDAASSLGRGSSCPFYDAHDIVKMQNESASKNQIECDCVQQESL